MYGLSALFSAIVISSQVRRELGSVLIKMHDGSCTGFVTTASLLLTYVCQHV